MVRARVITAVEATAYNFPQKLLINLALYCFAISSLVKCSWLIQCCAFGPSLSFFRGLLPPATFRLHPEFLSCGQSQGHYRCRSHSLYFSTKVANIFCTLLFLIIQLCEIIDWLVQYCVFSSPHKVPTGHCSPVEKARGCCGRISQICCLVFRCRL